MASAKTWKKATRREVACRVFSFELAETSSEEKGIPSLSEEENSAREDAASKVPNYVITPTGLRVNRVLVVGKLISIPKQIGDKEMWKIELSDGLGTFYAVTSNFQAQPLEYVKEIVKNLDIPKIVFLVGKVKTYSPDGSRLYVSIRPEVMCDSNMDAHYYWLLQSATFLLRRIDCIRELSKMEPPNLNNLISLGFTRSEAECALRAKDLYGIDEERLERYRAFAVNALKIVCGEDELTEVCPKNYIADVEGSSENSIMDTNSLPEPHLDADENMLYEMIKNYDDDGVSMEELTELTEMNKDKIESLVLSLIEKGLIDEPEPDKFRVIVSEDNEED